MKQPIMEVIRFYSEDVIATSVIPSPTPDPDPESLLEQSVDPNPIVTEPEVWG